MDIAAEISAMKTANLMTAVSTSVLKKAMDFSEESATMMQEMMEQLTVSMERSVMPHLGGNIDIRI